MCGLQWIDAEKPCGEMTAKGGVNGYGHTLGCYHLWTSAMLTMFDDVFLLFGLQQLFP